MIKGTFRLGGDIIHVVVDKENTLFSDTTGLMTTIDGLRLSKSGSIKEHPDLKNDDDWKKKTTQRFKDHIKTYKTEDQKIEYIKKELKKHAYDPQYKQRAGFRPKRFNGN